MHLYCPVLISHPQKWCETGRSFEKITLKDLGLVVQLGHFDAQPCPSPRRGREFVVIHTNGIHEVTVQFCACAANSQAAGSYAQQCLRSRWYPATPDDPATACTLDVIDEYLSLSSQNKASAYDYYEALAHLSSNGGLWSVPVCLHHTL